MKNVIDGIRQGLRADRLVLDLVGLDAAGEVKVYESLAPTNSKAPYVVWSIVPGGDIARVYGDEEAAFELNIQVTSWATNSKLAWQLADAVDDAIKSADFPTAPWELISLLRVGPPQPSPDRDTPLYQVIVPYTFLFSSAGRTDALT